MNPSQQAWFAFTSPEGTTLRCAECKSIVDLGSPTLDHHPGICPACGVESAFLNWKDRTIQVVMKNAPTPLVEAIRWSQEHFDELDYVEFLCALEEISDALSEAGLPK
ncbi:MAG TPA: hypothetical protein VNK04_23540 [Gemmataceae bacterium]|jgi:RNA polymerase subunit RPABC4/transcription elongation factor Spt4|nr:hypothetical protein [Gemmataceae bacterium]